MNSNNFELKPNERDAKAYFSVVSNEYLQAMDYAEKTLQNQGFITMRSVGIIGEKNNMTIITNILARNILTKDEVACMFSFPSRQQTSTKKTIIRAKKMNGYWKRINLFLCFTKGSGEFPIMARRIYSETTKIVKKKIVFIPLKVYSLNLNNGEIKELWRNHTNAQTEEKA